MDSNNSKQLKDKEPGSSESNGADTSQSTDLYQYETQHFGFTPTSLINGSKFVVHLEKKYHGIRNVLLWEGFLVITFPMSEN